jgi:dTDP-4-amino-4,6-dideoxygalactose transaminase
VRVQDGRRDALRDYLHDNGVASEVYYPVPVHKQTYYEAQLGYKMTLPEAERASREVLSLPVHPGLSKDDLNIITEKVNAFMKSTL